MSPYRKSIAAAVAAIAVVVADLFPEITGLEGAIAAAGAILVYWLPNAPHADEPTAKPVSVRWSGDEDR